MNTRKNPQALMTWRSLVLGRYISKEPDWKLLDSAQKVRNYKIENRWRFWEMWLWKGRESIIKKAPKYWEIFALLFICFNRTDREHLITVWRIIRVTVYAPQNKISRPWIGASCPCSKQEREQNGCRRKRFVCLFSGKWTCSLLRASIFFKLIY